MQGPTLLLQTLIIGSITLLGGLLPESLVWSGIALSLLSWFKKEPLQTLTAIGTSTVLTSLLLQKTNSLLPHEGPLNPVWLLVALWVLQHAHRNYTEKRWEWPEIPAAIVLLALYLAATQTLTALFGYPWHWSKPIKAESIALGALLLFHKKPKNSLLLTICFLCFWSLTSSPELLQKLQSLTSLPVSSQKIWQTLYFPAKNPGATMASLCVAWLLAQPSRNRTKAAAVLSLLILPQNSLGSIALTLLAWSLRIGWGPIAPLSKKKKLLLLIVSVSGGLLLLPYLPPALQTQNKDLRASGRIPASIHLLTQRFPDNPLLGENPTFRRTPAGSLSESIYLLSLKRNPTCNNLFIESLLQYGLPITTLLLLYLCALITTSPLSTQGKTLFGVTLIVAFNYSAVGPFSWDELGILWILPFLFQSPHPQIKPLPTPRINLKWILACLCFGGIAWTLLKSPPTLWHELWETPLQVTLTKHPPTPWPRNHGAHLPAVDILKENEKLIQPEFFRLSRPYLTHILHSRTQTPESSQKLRKTLEEKTQTPIKVIEGRWEHTPALQNPILFLTPLLAYLLLWTTLQKNPKLAGSLLLASSLTYAGAEIFPPKKEWTQVPIIINDPVTPTTPTWKLIWEKEIKKTSTGEILQFLLEKEGFPTEFYSSKTSYTGHESPAKLRKKTPTNLLTLAPQSLTQSSLKKIQGAIDLDVPTKNTKKNLSQVPDEEPTPDLQTPKKVGKDTPPNPR